MSHLAKLLNAENPIYIGDCVRNYLRINAPDDRVLTPEESEAEKAKNRLV